MIVGGEIRILHHAAIDENANHIAGVERKDVPTETAPSA